jgi:hypothetical protein
VLAFASEQDSSHVETKIAGLRVHHTTQDFGAFGASRARDKAMVRAI